MPDAKVNIVSTANLTGFTRAAAGAENLRREAERLDKITGSLNKSHEKQIGFLKGTHEAARGLAMQFPILGRLSHAALNPIGAAVTGITAAFSLWSLRMKEANRVLGGIELPDLSKTPPDRINAAAAAWDAYGKAIGRALEQVNSLEAGSEKVLQGIERRFDLIKQLGGKSPALDKAQAQATAGEKFRQAANLALRQRQRVQAAKGIGVASAVDDARNLSDAEAQKNVAEGEISDANKNIADASNYTRKGFWGRVTSPLQSWRMYKRYGIRDASRWRQIEGERISGFQPAVDRYWGMRGRAPERDQARARREELFKGAAEDFSAAGAARAEGRDISHQAQVQFGAAQFAAGNPVVPSVMGAGASTSAQAVNEIRLSYNQMISIISEFKRQNEELRRTVTQMGGRQQNRPDN